MLHRYAVILQEEALEEHRWATLDYAIVASNAGAGSSPKPPMRPAILDWAL